MSEAPDLSFYKYLFWEGRVAVELTFEQSPLGKGRCREPTARDIAKDLILLFSAITAGTKFSRLGLDFLL